MTRCSHAPQARRAIVLAGAVSILAACSTVREPVDEAAGRTAWTRYASGQDLRLECASGVPDRIRLIHRRDSERILAFNIREMPDGALVEAVEIGADDLGRFEPGNLPPAWRSGIRLSPEQYGYLFARLVEGGVFNIPVPPEMPVEGRIWLVTGCHTGTYFLGIWIGDGGGAGGPGLP